MEKDRIRCSSTEEALRVTPRRRGDAEDDGDGGCGRDDRAKMAPTTTFRSTNHAALEPSHAGSGQHHHAAIGRRALALIRY